MANTLSKRDCESLLADYPELPIDYLEWLQVHGWGTQASGLMLYSGPVDSRDIYDDQSEIPTSVVLLGDDFCGYCFGYDRHAGVFGECTPEGVWEPSSKEITLSSIVG